MTEILRAAPLYTFLWYCSQSPLPKIILDCGAGGNRPPLILFHELGFETHGIEISDENLQKVAGFEAEHQVKLNIQKGDMRQIPLPAESISFAYSFNSIFHLKPEDIAQSIAEIHRVLLPGGLCFINFLSVDDGEYGKGTEILPGVFYQNEYGHETLHTYFNDTEGDDYFRNFEIIRKEKRVMDLWEQGEKYRAAFIDYIVKK
jgi:SAM-dependent methyltransferase